MSDKRTFEGGCHCGSVRYRVKLDLSRGTTRCNCSLCTKTGLWGAHARPEDFELVRGEELLRDYQHGAKATHLYFCANCGVRSFSRGDAPWMGGPYVGINLNSVDDQAALAGVKVRWFDGLHDNWDNFKDDVAPAIWP